MCVCGVRLGVFFCMWLPARMTRFERIKMFPQITDAKRVTASRVVFFPSLFEFVWCTHQTCVILIPAAVRFVQIIFDLFKVIRALYSCDRPLAIPWQRYRRIYWSNKCALVWGIFCVCVLVGAHTVGGHHARSL